MVPKKESIQYEKAVVSESPVINDNKEVEENVNKIPTSTIINIQKDGEVKVSKVKKKKQKTEDKSLVRIKDAFKTEVEIMGGYLYVQANNLGTRDAIKALDIFDNIINQDVNNKIALERFERLVLKFSQNKTIGLSYL